MKYKSSISIMPLVLLFCFSCSDKNYSTHHAAIQIWNRTNSSLTCSVTCSSAITNGGTKPMQYDTIKDTLISAQDVVNINYTWIPGEVIVFSPDVPPEYTNRLSIYCKVAVPDSDFSVIHNLDIKITDNAFANLYVFKSPVKTYYTDAEFSELLSMLGNDKDKALLYNTYAQDTESGEWEMNSEYNKLECFEYYTDTVLCPMLETYDLAEKNFFVTFFKYSNWDADE